MTLAELSAFLAHDGVLLILPLAVFEGPVVSILAGVLCAQAMLPWYEALLLLVLGDLLGDGLFYAAGRLSHGWVHRLALRLRMPLARGEAFTAQVAARSTHMLLIGKWTHAIGGIVLIAAGAARVPFGRFLLVNLLATLPKSAVLMGFGYLVSANWEAAMQRFGIWTPVLLVVGGLAVWMALRRSQRPEDHVA